MRREVIWTLAIATLAAAPFVYLTTSALFIPDDRGVFPMGAHVGLDFLNFWTAGHFALEGRVADAYEPIIFKATLSEWFRPAFDFVNLSYPPSLLPWLVPFALLPFMTAYWIWTALGIGLTSWTALWRRPTREDLPLLALIVVAPVTLSSAIFGQISPFLAFLFVGALRVLPTQPLLAGAMIGLLTVKPQLGILLPVLLVGIGAWRTIFSAAVTAVALFAISIALFGIEPWRIYLTDTAALQWWYLMTMDGFYAIHMTSPFAGLWSLDVPIALAMKIQWMLMAVIVAATWLVARSAAVWPLKAAIVALGSQLAGPYAMPYDLVIPFTALIWFFSADRDAPKSSELALFGILWAMPFPLGFLLQAHGLPIAQLVALTLFGLLVGRALLADAHAWAGGKQEAGAR